MFHDRKRKELHKLKLDQLLMKDYVNKFLELLIYLDYIRDEKVKIQRFVSGFLHIYKDIIDLFIHKLYMRSSKWLCIVMSREREN